MFTLVDDTPVINNRNTRVYRHAHNIHCLAVRFANEQNNQCVAKRPDITNDTVAGDNRVYRLEHLRV